MRGDRTFRPSRRSARRAPKRSLAGSATKSPMVAAGRQPSTRPTGALRTGAGLPHAGPMGHSGRTSQTVGLRSPGGAKAQCRGRPPQAIALWKAQHGESQPHGAAGGGLSGAVNGDAPSMRFTLMQEAVPAQGGAVSQTTGTARSKPGSSPRRRGQTQKSAGGARRARSIAARAGQSAAGGSRGCVVSGASPVGGGTPCAPSPWWRGVALLIRARCRIPPLSRADGGRFTIVRPEGTAAAAAPR